MPVKLRLPNRSLAWPRRGLVMAILNINDDSFSNDGSLDPDWAVERAIRLIGDGADVIDVGAESARTNRAAISVEEEIARFEQFCQKWPTIVERAKPRDDRQVWPPVLSANTWRSEVVARVLPMGVDLLNDMSGLPNLENAKLCQKTASALLIMHSVGLPKVDHSHVVWDDILEAMSEFFSSKIELACSAGLTNEQLVLDPGFGFAKQAGDDLATLKNLEKLTAFERPLLVPVGRKGFIGDTLDIKIPAERDAATLACVAAAYQRGGHIFRVHDARGCFEALKVLTALQETTV